MKSPQIVELAMFGMIALGGPQTAQADTIQYSFTIIDVPDARYDFANGINDSGQIVGYYYPSIGPIRGFLYSYSDGSFTMFDIPGLESAEAINNSGQIVGSYHDSTGVHGFLDTAGSITSIDVPGASSTRALGINDNGQIVGRYSTSEPGAPIHSFLDTGGSFTTIEVPGAEDTYASGINNVGQIVGYYVDSLGNTRGFLDSGGSLTTIQFPGANGTSADGINDSGQIVGHYSNSGFLAMALRRKRTEGANSRRESNSARKATG